MFYPYSSGGGWLNNDWFEHARLRGGSLLWTEDCELLHALQLLLAPFRQDAQDTLTLHRRSDLILTFVTGLDDGMSYYWSYYAALMGGACRLAAPTGGTKIFGWYIVPRRSGGAIEGALLRRVVALIGNGAKALTYYAFGPEYNYPGNCYIDSRNIDKILSQQREAHTLVARAEAVLWPATKVASRVSYITLWLFSLIAALRFGTHRAQPSGRISSRMWSRTKRTNSGSISPWRCTVTFLWISSTRTPWPTPRSWLATQCSSSANPTSASAVTAAAWVRQGGKLVLSGGAAVADEYNAPLFTFSNLRCDLRCAALGHAADGGAPEPREPGRAELVLFVSGLISSTKLLRWRCVAARARWQQFNGSACSRVRRQSDSARVPGQRHSARDVRQRWAPRCSANTGRDGERDAVRVAARIVVLAQRKRVRLQSAPTRRRSSPPQCGSSWSGSPRAASRRRCGSPCAAGARRRRGPGWLGWRPQ